MKEKYHLQIMRRATHTTLQKDRYGETDTSLKTIKDISKTAKQIEGNLPLFRYFLDGSRRIYIIDDIELGKKIFPIIGGQIGILAT